MKFTLGWLKDHLATDAPLEAIVDTLTAIGLEVEGVDDPGAKLRAFTVARVLKAEPHPNADRLRVCTVETAGGTVQVVCGAPNARTGMMAVYAGVGSYVPGIDRIAMLKYGIPDLRTFFEADLRWLGHYGFAPLDVPSLARGL